MKWKLKSRIQNLIAKLPANLSYATYYFFQRNFSGSSNIIPMDHLIAGIKIARYIHQQEHVIAGKTFLEIGTGRQLNLPLALWLSGAKRIITVDLNPYLKEELVFDGISYLRNHQPEIKTLFEEIKSPVFRERFNQLIRGENNLQQLLALTGIQYLAPANATCLDLAARSVDYHISFTTLEHIPRDTLRGIFREGKRILRKRGLFLHCVDFSDHFSHSDKSILPINFLRFNDREWERLAGNIYMYHNRLRVDDLIDLFRNANLRIQSLDIIIDKKSSEELRKGFPLDNRFIGKAVETNAATSAWIVASNPGVGSVG